MKHMEPAIADLIQALRVLPGVGQKTAQRMAFALLDTRRSGAAQLAHTLEHALEVVGRCSQCRTLSEQTVCSICSNDTRAEHGILCVVETPTDVLAVESTQAFHGQYFVLMGHLSPLDGVGPSDLGLDYLEQRFQQEPIKEIILATNPTVEGEATAHYIAEMAAQYDIETSRIAHGVPVGGELEYVDNRTLGHAFEGRKKLL